MCWEDGPQRPDRAEEDGEPNPLIPRPRRQPTGSGPGEGTCRPREAGPGPGSPSA